MSTYALDLLAPHWNWIFVIVLDHDVHGGEEDSCRMRIALWAE